MNNFELYRQTPADMAALLHQIMQDKDIFPSCMPSSEAEWEEWLMRDVEHE